VEVNVILNMAASNSLTNSLLLPASLVQ